MCIGRRYRLYGLGSPRPTTGYPVPRRRLRTARILGAVEARSIGTSELKRGTSGVRRRIEMARYDEVVVRVELYGDEIEKITRSIPRERHCPPRP